MKDRREGEKHVKPIIELQDVWKIYQMGDIEVPALRGVNLTIRVEEFVAIMGPSGSGKSTLMNMVGCLDVPTRGTILLDKDDISRMTESELAQIRGRKIGFIFQSFNLMPGLTALDNVTLPLVFQDILPDEREARAIKVLKEVGLGKRITHKPTELSGGEQQRVAIARALVGDPEVVLADEPTGNLDSKTSKDVMNMLFDLHEKEGKTVIIVTHDEDMAKYAERLVKIKDGQISTGKNKNNKGG